MWAPANDYSAKFLKVYKSVLKSALTGENHYELLVCGGLYNFSIGCYKEGIAKWVEAMEMNDKSVPNYVSFRVVFLPSCFPISRFLNHSFQSCFS